MVFTVCYNRTCVFQSQVTSRITYFFHPSSPIHHQRTRSPHKPTSLYLITSIERHILLSTIKSYPQSTYSKSTQSYLSVLNHFHRETHTSLNYQVLSTINVIEKHILLSSTSPCPPSTCPKSTQVCLSVPKYFKFASQGEDGPPCETRVQHES